MIDIELFRKAVEDARDGITIADFNLQDSPLIYVNPAFERMTGYISDEVLGKNCRYLQGDDSEQEGVFIIRSAIENKESCVTRLRNYRKDGTMFWNELSLSPVFDKFGNLTHYLGIQKDVTSEMLLMYKLRNENSLLKDDVSDLISKVNIDPLTGIHNRRYLDNQIKIAWEVSLRKNKSFCVMMIDIDYFKKYNDKYGHQAGDLAIQEVARTLNSSFLKTTDFVARYGGEEFIIVVSESDKDNAKKYAMSVAERIQSLAIINEDSQHGFITVSIGMSSCLANPSLSLEALIKKADEALYRAKSEGRNKVCMLDVF